MEKIRAEQLERKQRSIERLKKMSIPWSDDVPVIAPAVHTQLRKYLQVCERAMCLAFVSARAEGMDYDTNWALIRQYGLEPALTSDERDFLDQRTPTDYYKSLFIWRYESMRALLWALSYVEHLGDPLPAQDVTMMVSRIAGQTREDFIRNAVLRSKEEIMDQADLTYRYHWVVEQGKIKGRPLPSIMDASTVYERHYALSWLTCTRGDDWDNIDVNSDS